MGAGRPVIGSLISIEVERQFAIRYYAASIVVYELASHRLGDTRDYNARRCDFDLRFRFDYPTPGSILKFLNPKQGVVPVPLFAGYAVCRRPLFISR